METAIDTKLINSDALTACGPSNLVGTTWFIQAVNRDFITFDATFNANGTGTDKGVSAPFYGQMTWSGNEASVIFIINWGYGHSTWNCHANPEKGTGVMHHTFNGVMYTSPFTMVKK